MILYNPSENIFEGYNGVFIKNMLLAYGTESGLFDLWGIFNDDKQTGTIFRMDGTVRICGKCENLDEVRAFLATIGYQYIFADREILCEPANENQEILIMQYDKDRQISENPSVLLLQHEDLRSIYTLVFGKKCDGNDFSVWYSDVSHRMRHGLLRAYGIKQNDTLVSVSMTVAETENEAVIGCVTTDTKYRNLGLASAVVSELTRQLANEKKSVTLAVNSNSNVGLYCRIGFFVTARLYQMQL